MLRKARLKRKAIVALAKMGRFATDDALPLALRGVHTAQELVDDLTVLLLGNDFEERVRRVPVNHPDGGVDPFGFNLDAYKRAIAACAFLHKVYFRAEAHGLENVPAGRVLVVSNHSGQLPIDGVLIATSMFYEAEPPRIVRSMVEKWTQTLPFVGTFFQRVGQIVGVPENARRLLEQGEAVLVFPEGARGISKPFAQRYQLTEFGLGFMRLALETNTPIVPVAVIGAEEQYVNLGNSRRLAKLLQMPVFPLVPQWYIPGAQMPLPTKYRLYFGPALHFDGDPDDEDAIIEDKVARVKESVEKMLEQGLAKRRGIFW